MPEQQLSQAEFTTIPIILKAIQWTEEMGAVFGVLIKPKKHEMNPSEFYVKTRFKKEIPIRPTDWVLQFADNSYDVVEDSAFRGLYALFARPVPTPTAAPNVPTSSGPDAPETKTPKKPKKR